MSSRRIGTEWSRLAAVVRDVLSRVQQGKSRRVEKQARCVPTAQAEARPLAA